MQRNTLIYLIITFYTHISIRCLPEPFQQPSVPGEYILHLGDYGEEDIPTLVLHAKLVTVYAIGSEKFALIKLEPTSPFLMLQMLPGDTISNHIGSVANVTLHPNRIYNAMSVDDNLRGAAPEEWDGCSCSVQGTGRKYWGLTRISSRNRPDFTSDSYAYNDTGHNVTVFVMDSGVNVNHVTFGGRAVVGFTARDLLESEGAADLTGHGTAVASIIAGSDHGVAKQASIVSVKVLDQDYGGTDDRLLEGLAWISKAINGSSGDRFVINLSLAGLIPGNSSCMEDNLCRALDKVGAVTVVAAGNQKNGRGSNTCDFVPAKFSNLITVAATDISDQLWDGTSYGRCVDMLAPGHGILVASHMDNTAEMKKSGTSFAAPFVSGVLARHLENYSYQPSTRDMLQLLRETATKNSTNAKQYSTPDYLVYRGCPRECRRHETTSVALTAMYVVIGLFVVICVCASICIWRFMNRENVRPRPTDNDEYIRIPKTETML